MTNMPAAVTRAARIATAPNTHFQFAYEAMRPDRRFPKMLPKGAPDADQANEEQKRKRKAIVSLGVHHHRHQKQQ
jgi:hypothetical protein